MTLIKRRHFLQSAGSALAVLGLSQWEIQQQGLRYAQSLAQGSSRKIALLVGINDYASPVTPLRGCITDVQLHRELLVHRFGFNPKDILVITDGQATRQGILTAFEEHLIKQAKPGDIVVFHFSGHGSQVSDKPDCDSQVTKASPDCVNSTLVVQDSFLPNTTFEGGPVNDITGHTLFLLMSALQTDNVTAILDCCHAGGGTRGNFLVRAIPRMGGSEQFLPSPAEKQYQQQWLSRLKLPPEEFIQRRRANVAKGVVVASARREQYAADAPFGDFHAGAFTYTMTRYLWQQTLKEGVGNSLLRINLSAKTQAALSGIAQDPLSEANPTSNNDRPFYFLPVPGAPAEAVVTQVNGKQFSCWLGGVDGETLDAFGNAAQFAVIDSQGKEQGLVKLLSREGLIAKGELVSGRLSAGALLQEKVRGIPNDLPLEIAIDASLKGDEAALQQALQSLRRVKAVPAGQGGQYLLVRLTDTYRQTIAKTAGTAAPTVGSIGLLTPGGDRIITGSFGPTNESVVDAVARLRSQFTALLANRLLQLLRNTNSSQVAVNVQIKPAQDSRGAPIATVGTSRKRSAAKGGNMRSGAATTPLTQRIKIGSKIQVQVTNEQGNPLYIAILGIGSSGEMAVLFPSDWNAPSDASLVKPKESIAVPRPGKDRFEFQIDGPPGVVQVMVLASTTSLRNALKGLQQIASQRGIRSGLLTLENDAAKGVEGLLGGLDENTRAFVKQVPTNQKAISTSQLAAISLSLEVVA
jgi:Caspase domain/Domain of unknown function (DUF4384)